MVLSAMTTSARFAAGVQMRGNGPTGQFANLETKLKHEIPMAVFLPTGGPVSEQSQELIATASGK